MTLADLARRGFLPTFDESEAAFYERATAAACQNEALDYFEQLFCMRPDWVPLFEGRAKLAPWQGAVLWVDDKNRPTVQVAPRRGYSREEMIAHELIHAVRLPLRSKRFEEIIAYQTSRKWWRRFFGPIVRTPSEVYVFLFALLCHWIPLFWCGFIFPALLLFGLTRLCLTQRIFYRCRRTLSRLVGKDALALVACLTDAEIALFARLKPDAIRAYVANQEQLRWKLLKTLYPSLALSSGGQTQKGSIFSHGAASAEDSGAV
jgi:hypothetical protein